MKKIIMIATAIFMVATIANAETHISVCLPLFDTPRTYTVYTEYVVHHDPFGYPPPPPHYYRPLPPPPPPPPRHFHRPPPPPPPPRHFHRPPPIGPGRHHRGPSPR